MIYIVARDTCSSETQNIQPDQQYNEIQRQTSTYEPSDSGDNKDTTPQRPSSRLSRSSASRTKKRELTKLEE